MDKTLIKKFLPKNADIDFLGKYTTLIVKDLDDDGKEEALILYTVNDKYYLAGLKKDREWKGLFNRITKYRQVDYYECIKLAKGAIWHIVIGGYLKGMASKQLMVLEWQFDQLISISDKYIAYDEITILEGREGTQQIQTDVKEENGNITKIYHYYKNKLVENTKQKTGGKIEDVLIEEEEVPREEEEVPREEEQMQEEQIQVKAKNEEVQLEKSFLIEGCTAYLENWKQEEDVFLLGIEEGREHTHRCLYILMTSSQKTQRHVQKISDMPIKEYALAIGDYLNQEKEQVFLALKDDEDRTYYNIWSIEDGRFINHSDCMEEISKCKEIEGWYENHLHITLKIKEQVYGISLRNYPQRYLEQWYENEGALKGNWYPYIEIDEIHPVYKELDRKYEIHSIYGVWDTEKIQKIGTINIIYEGYKGQLVWRETSCSGRANNNIEK